jgi:hypothetical protein
VQIRRDRRQLRGAKLANRRPSKDEVSIHTRALKIDVPTERYDRWQSAAEQQTVLWQIGSL